MSESVLQIYELRGTRYFEISERWLEQVELGLTLWQGEFEERTDTWLRWCDQSGKILLTGDERAKLLAERLQALGIDSDDLS